MTLQERVAALEETQKYVLAIELLELALPIWETYVQQPDIDLDYLISPFHGFGAVDPAIVSDAIAVIKRFLAPHSIEEKEVIQKEIDRLRADYANHLMGLNDWELELEAHPKLVFYAGFNLLEYTHEKINIFKESSIYVSINQSVDALIKREVLTWDAVRDLLDRYSSC